MVKRNNLSWIWPKIVDAKTAKEARWQGVVASLFILGVSATHALLSAEHFRSPSLIDGLIFGIIGWRIYKLSRIAAIAGLSFHLINRIYMWNTGREGPEAYGMAAFITLLFVNSVRGTFAYNRFSKPEAKPPIRND